MKRLSIISLALITIGLACKSKMATASSNPVSDAQFTVVKSRFPDATKEELQKGYSVYKGACTDCHKPKKITEYTEPKLLEIVDVMSKKAKITAEEKQALIRFAVGIRANPN